MGLGGIGIWQLLIILAIVVMLFGTGRLRTLGSDLGSAIRGFRDSAQDDSATVEGAPTAEKTAAAAAIDAKPGDGRPA